MRRSPCSAAPRRFAVYWLGLCALLAGSGCSSAAALEDLPVFNHPSSAEQLMRTVLRAPTAELTQAQVLSGQFTQRRYLSGLARALVSSGEFLLVRETGIDWHTRTPFESEMVLTDAGMLLRDSPGAVPEAATRLSAQEQPALRAVLSILMAMFTLDVRRLEDSFELYGVADDGDKDSWQVGLKPKQAALKTVFRAAVIHGARHVEGVELVDSNGDRTEIAFSQVSVRTTQLDDEALERFR